MVYIGERLKDFREKRKLTQENMAECLQISQSKLSKLEKNKDSLAICDVINITKQYKDINIYLRWRDKIDEIVFNSMKGA